MQSNTIDVAFMRNRFYYEPELGQLFYRHNIGIGVRKGDRAGTIGALGCRVVNIGNHHYSEHRIIYAIVTGRDPKDLVIRHVDGCKDNNNFYNLEASAPTENIFKAHDPEVHPLERKVNNRNTSGIAGVSWHKQKKKWELKVAIGNERRFLGTCRDLETARQKICTAWDEYQSSLNA